MLRLIQSFRRLAATLGLLTTLTLLAACDPLIATDKPLTVGPSITSEEAEALTGDYTLESSEKGELVEVTWRARSGVAGHEGDGAIRLQMKDKLTGTVAYDVSALLSPIKSSSGTPESGLYFASLIPSLSMAHEPIWPNDKAFEPQKFASSIFAIVQLDKSESTVALWPVLATEGGLLDSYEMVTEGRLFAGADDTPVLRLGPITLSGAILLNEARIRGEPPTYKMKRAGGAADMCKADVMMRSQAYSDNTVARERYAIWLADSVAACPQNCGEAVGWIASRSLNGSAAAKARLRQWQSKNTCSVADGNNPVLRDYLVRAKAGDKDAMYYLGVLYGMDTGVVPLNVEQAVKWYLAGAAAGQADSQYRAGQFYQLGVREPDGSRVYVRASNAKARYWYEKAAAGGHPKAAQALRAMAASGSQPDTDAEDWLKAAGALVVTYCVLNPDDCFGENKPAAPAEAQAGGSSCSARVASGLMRCKSLVDYNSCTMVGCDHYWDCDRVSRYIKNDKVRYYSKRYDVRQYGKCSRPSSSWQFDDWLYCDPETGKKGDTYAEMVSKACK